MRNSSRRLRIRVRRSLAHVTKLSEAMRVDPTTIKFIVKSNSRTSRHSDNSRDLNTVAMAKSKNSSQHNQSKKAHRNGYAISGDLRMSNSYSNWADVLAKSSIKKPKTSRYPSLKGTDPKFRRNHRHALHGTMKALVGVFGIRSIRLPSTNKFTEGVQGGQAGVCMKITISSLYFGNLLRRYLHWQGRIVQAIEGKSTMAKKGTER
jgi:large subunit ribosomal protein L29e